MNKERQKQNKIAQKTIELWQKHSKKFSNLVLVHETMGSNSVTPTHRSILRGTPIFYCYCVSFLMLLHGNISFFRSLIVTVKSPGV